MFLWEHYRRVPLIFVFTPLPSHIHSTSSHYAHTSCGALASDKACSNGHAYPCLDLGSSRLIGSQAPCQTEPSQALMCDALAIFALTDLVHGAGICQIVDRFTVFSGPAPSVAVVRHGACTPTCCGSKAAGGH